MAGFRKVMVPPTPTEPESISDETWAHLRSALVRFFSGKLRDPEDQAQETITRVQVWLKKGNTVQGNSGIEKLCFGFAKNVLHEGRERANRAPAPLPEDFSASSNLTKGLNSSECRALLHQTLDRLSVRDGQLIIDAENLSPEQLAEKYGQPKRLLAVRLFRARERLRALLESPRVQKGSLDKR